jgi:hypothetical protein
MNNSSVFNNARSFIKNKSYKRLNTYGARFDGHTEESIEFLEKFEGDNVYIELPGNRRRLYHIFVSNIDRHVINIEIEADDDYLEHELNIEDIINENPKYTFYIRGRRKHPSTYKTKYSMKKISNRKFTARPINSIVISKIKKLNLSRKSRIFH